MSSDPFDRQIEEFSKKIREYLVVYGENGQRTLKDQEDLQTRLSIIVEELQVAGDELRQQNEQLNQAQVQLAEETRRYQTLFQLAPDAYLVTDGLGVVTEANQAASELLGVPAERLAGRPVAMFFRHADLQDMLDHLRNVQQTSGGHEWETSIFPRGVTQRDVLVSLAVDHEAPGRDRRLLWLLRDVTNHREAERKLHQSQSRFSAIFGAAEMGIALMDLQGVILEANPAFQRMTGYRGEGLAGLRYQDMLSPKPDSPELRQFLSLITKGHRRYDLEHELRCKGGETIWVRTAVSLLRDRTGNPEYVLGLFEDITLLHQRNREIIELEGQLEDSAERERESLARDLHDGPLQRVLSVLFKLQCVIHDHPGGDFIPDLEAVKVDIQQVVDELRVTSGLLRPPTLAHFGLVRATESLVDQIREAFPDVNINLEIDNTNQEYSPRVQQGAYRILQQALMNVQRHSQASDVTVRLFQTNNHLILEVEDNGLGFVVPKRWMDLTEGKHYGLVGSAERAAALGGALRIHSKPGEGTLVQVSVPVLEGEQRKHTLADLAPEIPEF